MLLDQIKFDEIQQANEGDKPLLDTKDEARKSVFKKLNRVGNRQGGKSPY